MECIANQVYTQIYHSKKKLDCTFLAFIRLVSHH